MEKAISVSESFFVLVELFGFIGINDISTFCDYVMTYFVRQRIRNQERRKWGKPVKPWNGDRLLRVSPG